MEVSEVFLELSGLVRETAPHLWEVARRQVLSVAVLLVAWGGLLGLFGGLLIGFGRSKFDPKSMDNSISGSATMIGLFVIVSGLALITCAILRFWNPDYYAIKYL